MSTETKIKTIEEDPNSLYRIQKIRLTSDKSITTPSKTIPLDILKLKDKNHLRSNGVNEIFKRLTAKKINLAEEENEHYVELENWFNSQKNKMTEETPNLCIIDFDEKRLPTVKETEFMVDFAYCNSHITTIPTISHINQKGQKEISYSDYKAYLEQTIETIEQLNHKSIMGVIPKLAPKHMSDLIDFYSSKGINSFALDLNGSNPVTYANRLFKILRALKKKEALENSYLHAHNVGIRVNKNADVVPAKDILGYGLGLGSLGEKRKKFHPNREFIEMIKNNPENKFRIFDKEDYGYWKNISAEKFKEICPADCSFSEEDFTNIGKRSYLQRMVNAEQLSIESDNLKEVISEDAEKTINYLKSKKHVLPDDVTSIEQGRKKIK